MRTVTNTDHFGLRAQTKPIRAGPGVIRDIYLRLDTHGSSLLPATPDCVRVVSHAGATMATVPFPDHGTPLDVVFHIREGMLGCSTGPASACDVLDLNPASWARVPEKLYIALYGQRAGRSIELIHS